MLKESIAEIFIIYIFGVVIPLLFLYIIGFFLGIVNYFFFTNIRERMEKYHPRCRKILRRYQILSNPPIYLGFYKKEKFDTFFNKIYSYEQIKKSGDIYLTDLISRYRNFSRYCWIFVTILTVLFVIAITLFIILVFILEIIYPLR